MRLNKLFKLMIFIFDIGICHDRIKFIRSYYSCKQKLLLII